MRKGAGCAGIAIGPVGCGGKWKFEHEPPLLWAVLWNREAIMRKKIEIYILSAFTISSFISTVIATLIVVTDQRINGRHESFDLFYLTEIFGIYYAFFAIPMIWFGAILFVFLSIFVMHRIFSRLFTKGW